MLVITEGDDAVLNLKATMSDGTAVNLTGATFETRVRGIDNVVVLFGNSKHTANPDQTGHRGEFTLTLTPVDTASIKVGESQEIITKITISGKIVYFHGKNQLNVLSADPLPDAEP